MFGFVASGILGGLAIAVWGGCAVYFAEHLAREVRASRIGQTIFIGFVLRIIYWPWIIRLIGGV